MGSREIRGSIVSISQNPKQGAGNWLPITRAGPKSRKQSFSSAQLSEAKCNAASRHFSGLEFCESMMLINGFDSSPLCLDLP